MAEDVTCRLVTDLDADWPDIWPLMDSFYEHHRALTGGRLRPGYDEKAYRYFEDLLRRDPHLFFLAEREGDVIGMATGYIKAAGVTQGGPVGYAGDAFVKAEQRGRGAGSVIYRFRDEWFRQQKMRRWEGLMLAANEHRLTIAPHLGHIPWGSVLRKPVGDSPAPEAGSPIIVRRVRDIDSDWSLVRPLVAQPGLAETEQRAALARRLEKRGILLVAGDPPVALALAHLSINPWILDERVLMLTELRHPASDKAAAAALLARLEAWASSKGATSIQYGPVAYGPDTPWRERGFEPFFVYYYKSLEEAPAV